ncbi:MAG: response regulator [Bacteroides sp.]|nr:response regulator [Bacteroides sp.]
MKRHFFLLLILLLSFTSVRAEDFMFKHLEVKDGLPNNSIIAIIKDSKGFMWYGTASGLTRYDGHNFYTFRNQKNDTLSIPDNYVDFIIEDKDENLWMRAGGELVLYDLQMERFVRNPDTYYKKAGIPDKPHYVYVDSEGDYWFYQNWNGCYYYHRKSGEAQHLLVAEDALPSGQLRAMTEHGDEMILLFENGEMYGIDKYTMHISWKERFLADRLTNNAVEEFAMFKDAEDYLWIYSAGGVWVYDLANKAWLHDWNKRLAKRNAIVKTIAQDSKGRIWIGKDQDGIDVWDKHTATFVVVAQDEERDNERGLQNNTINVLYADNSDMMWVGTHKKGVSYYHESIYKFGIELLGDVNSIEEAKDGCLWLGTNGLGLIHWNPKTGEKRIYAHRGQQSITSDIVVSLLRASDGKLWIGTYRGGLNCFDGVNFRHYKHQPDNPNSIANNNVWSLAEDADGNIWIGTLGGGLQCLNPKTGRFTTYNTQNSTLHSDYIASICYSKKGVIVIGTASEGVSIFNLHNKTFYNLQDEEMGGTMLSNQNINQVYEDHRGLIWIATRDGLNMYDFEKKQLRQIYSSMAAERFISGLVEDENGNMWVTTARSVTNIMLTQPDKNEEYTFQYVTYDEKDGLQSSAFNHRAIKRLGTGEIVMGGLYGINLFHPDMIGYNKRGPKVMFTDFRLFNQRINVGAVYDGHVVLNKDVNSVDKVRLNYKQNIFGVNFASDCYMLPDRIKYVYKLEGFSDTWMTLSGGQARVTYTNLSPGNYELVVKAINSDDVAGTEISRLKIEIRPPFWKTTWAYCLYALCGILLLYLGVWMVKLREQNRYKIRQLQEDVKKQENEAQMKFRLFTDVSNELRTPLTLIIAPLEGMIRTAVGKQHEQLGMIHRNAMSLLNLINQLPDFSNEDSENEPTDKQTSKETIETASKQLFEELMPANKVAETMVTNEEEDVTDEEAAEELDKAKKNKPLALVVDDNEDILSFLQDSLSLYFRVKTAKNGYEAWRMMPNLLPDIVVSDVAMPEMDGNELCRWIKCDSRTEHIPVILLTAKNVGEKTEESHPSGADVYMAKPFNVEVLVLRMRKLLDSSARKLENRFTQSDANDTKITSMDEQLVVAAWKYVEENMARTDLSVEELSQSLDMDRVVLYKKLLQITGKTPVEFIRIIRLKHAAQMLRESDRNVTEVAYLSGFNNPKYFINYFKEEFGVSPSVYQSSKN